MDNKVFGRGHSTLARARLFHFFLAIPTVLAILCFPAHASGFTTATVTIDADQQVRVIPRTIYGSNLEWIYNGDLAWNRNSHKFKKSIVSAGRRIGVGMLRFPGGVYADYYNWLNGVGAPSQRPVVPDGYDGGRYANPVGTDEIMRLSRELGSLKPLLQTAIVAPIGLAPNMTPAKLAAAWVDYCNDPNNQLRAANGSPAPYDVRYWEIGNEPYYPGRGHMSPADYVRKLRRFSAAMKAVDPTIKIGAVSIPREIVPRWQKYVISHAASSIDFIALHGAYAPNLDSGLKGASLDQVYQAMLAYPIWIGRIVNEAERDVSQLASPADAERIRYAVTEWGPLFSNHPTNQWYDQTRTLGSALFVASTLETLVRDPRIEIANYFKLTGPLNMGLITDRGKLKVTALAFAMFTRHFGSRLVKTVTRGPTYNSVHTGWMPAIQGVPDLDVISSRDASGHALYIMVVNKSLTSAVPTNITIRGASPSGKAEAWTITGASIQADNGPDIDVPLIEHHGLRISREVLSPIDDDHPGTVVFRKTTYTHVGKRIHYTFPPMSITSIKIALR